MNAIMQRGGVKFDSYENGWRLAQSIVAANMQPKSFGQGKQAACACFVAMQAGAEIGLSPMQSIQNIAVINGKPGIYGPAALALVEASGKLADIDEAVEGKGEERAAAVTLQRVGRKARTFRFSVADAKKAGLWGKSGPWTQYPDRMLLARARGFALRDVFPDVLLGCSHSIEELTEGAAEDVHSLPRATVQQQASAAPAAPSAIGGGLDEFIETTATEQPAATGQPPQSSVDEFLENKAD